MLNEIWQKFSIIIVIYEELLAMLQLASVSVVKTSNQKVEQHFLFLLELRRHAKLETQLGQLYRKLSDNEKKKQCIIYVNS